MERISEKVEIKCGDHSVYLTWREINEIYNYAFLGYLEEDITSRLDDCGSTNDVNIVQQKKKEIAELACQYLEDCEPFWDSYWANINCAIKDFIKDYKSKEGQNDETIQND